MSGIIRKIADFLHRIADRLDGPRGPQTPEGRAHEKWLQNRSRL